MSKPKWHSGPPPSIGWWPASYSRNTNVIRWWNGKWWSVCHVKSSAIVIEKSDFQNEIKWTERPDWWPERSKT